MTNGFSDEIIAELLAEIASTPKSLESICSADERYPSSRTFYRWIDTDEALCQRYARAKQAQMQVLADQIVDLADTERICQKVTMKADGSREVVILDQVERTKLQIDSRKWLLSKLDPKKYGDRVSQELTGKDGAPLGITIVSSIPRPERES